MSNTMTSPAGPRVLIANDQEWTARSLESILTAEGCEIVRAYTGQQALDRAADQPPDLIILDTQLPDISGPEVCRQLRARPSIGWGTPIIITTAGSNGRTRQTEALEAGAWDFLTQPFDGPLLLARIHTYLRARSELAAARAAAFVDPATGLYNIAGLTQRLAELSSDATRRHQPLTCVVLSAGSPDLVEAARSAETLEATIGHALRRVVRGSDAVARIGVLQFAIAAPTLDRDDALKLVARFERCLAELRPAGTPAVAVQAALAPVEAGTDLAPEEILRRAMTALAAQAVAAGSSEAGSSSRER